MVITPSMAILLIVAATVIGAVFLYAVFALLGALFVPARGDHDDRSLVERANAIRPPRTFFGRLDRDFEDTVRGTLFDIGTDRAIEVILLVGGIGALLAFVLTEDYLAAAFGLLFGMLLAVLLFWVFGGRRRRAIQEQLPDGCFQMARCLRAGLGMSAAVGEAAAYSPQPMSGVFQNVHRRLEMGMAADAAFAREAHDVRLTDFDLLAAIVALHAEVGGNLPLMLDKLATTIRDRNQFRGYYRSVTSLARATTLFVALAAPLALIAYFILQPELATYYLTPRGWVMLAIAFLLWVIGVLWSLWLLRRNEEY